MNSTFFNKRTFVSFLILLAFIITSGLYRTAHKNTSLQAQETEDADNVLNPSCDGETSMEELLSLNRKEQVTVSGVPMILQKPELPTGCEVASAAMALCYLGIDADKVALADEIPKSPLPYIVDGEFVGDSPNNTFIGSPFSSSGFGVYHTPIFDLMAKYTSYIKDITGSSFDTLKYYLEQGNPIIVWASVSMEAVTDGGGWYVDGQYFNWKKHEHCLVLVGYTDSQVIVNDPLEGVVNYSISAFVDAYNAMGSQAILVNK